MNKKIFIILPDLRIGGAEKNSVFIANELIEKGNEVIFLLQNNLNNYKNLLNKNIQIISLNQKRIRSLFIPLLKLFKSHKPDVIITSMWPLTSISILSSLFAFIKMKILIVEHVPIFTSYKHETKSSKLTIKFFMKYTYKFADKIICVSNGIKNEIIRETLINKEKFKVIYNPVVNHNFVPQVKSSNRIKRVLTVGSLKYAKNHELLIKSFFYLSKQINVELTIVGEGELKDELLKLISKLNLSTKVTILNFQEDISKYYLNSDVFVLTSRWEGLGNVIIESLSYGIPVVSTDCPYGPREILGDDSNIGILINSNNPKKISDNIFYCLNKNYDRNKIIEYSKKFTIKNQVNKYINLIDEK